MAQVKSVIEVCDPYAKERKVVKEVGREAEFQQAALNLIAMIFVRNMNAKKVGDERFYVYAVHRTKGIHVRFNLAMTVVQNNQIRAVTIGSDINQESVLVRPDVEYGGALSNAETLLSGDWRVASLEEEVELAAKDKAAADAVIAERLKAKHGDTDAIRTASDSIKDLANALTKKAVPALAKG